MERGHLPTESPKRLLALVALLGIGGDIQLAESQAHLRSGLGFFLGYPVPIPRFLGFSV